MILRDYQMPDDPGGMVQWEPGAPLGWFTGSVNITSSEAKMLNRLSPFELKDFNDIRNKAFDTADAQFPAPQEKRDQFSTDKKFKTWAHNDGHNDAFRHSYWNALLTQRFGAEFSGNFTNAHDGIAGNEADREAMDLYNNSIGRRIAQENPKATPEQLATLLRKAINDGQMIVIDKNGNLAWSDKVAYGEHGVANDGPAPGVMAPADANARTQS
jgi:hypothetical protein